VSATVESTPESAGEVVMPESVPVSAPLVVVAPSEPSSPASLGFAPALSPPQPTP
jgi:hypothetical protein